MATKLPQLEERQSAEQEVMSYNPGQTINQGLKKTGEIMLAVKPLLSVQMIASLGGDVKMFAFSPSSLYFSWKRT